MLLFTVAPDTARIQAHLALALRVGLSLVFIIGGLAKLARLLDPAQAQGIVNQYVGPAGYINQFFLDYLFAGHLPSIVTPWSFLTVLSSFEFLCGVLLLAGLFVRPLSLIWALLLWTFVISLPVTTTPGVLSPAPTYTSPAELVQIRDIALSGFFLVLYNLGAGRASLDAGRFGLPEAMGRDWNPLGLLLRVSLGTVFLVGGLFHGFNNIATFGMPALILLPIGLLLVAGMGERYAAIVGAAVLLWFMAEKIPGSAALVGYLNAVKREFALVAVAIVVAIAGGGKLFNLASTGAALRDGLRTYFMLPRGGR